MWQKEQIDVQGQTRENEWIINIRIYTSSVFLLLWT